MCEKNLELRYKKGTIFFRVYFKSRCQTTGNFLFGWQTIFDFFTHVVFFKFSCRHFGPVSNIRILNPIDGLCRDVAHDQY